MDENPWVEFKDALAQVGFTQKQQHRALRAILRSFLEEDRFERRGNLSRNKARRKRRRK